VFSVYGVENPLMDIIAHVDFAFLKRLGKKPGTMNLVDYEEIERLRAGVGSFRTIPGGSCANTIRGIAWLNRSGGLPSPVFNGAVGRDAIGDQYIRGIEEFGVGAAIVRKSTATGMSLILVTPDGERTMNTYLGACREFTPEDLDVDKLSHSRILHLTGYLWDTENQRRASRKAIEIACGKGLTISFDLADPFAVQRYSEVFLPLIPECVDMLFANREELGLLTKTECAEDCMKAAASLAPIVVMKAGAEGCYISRGGKITHVPGVAATLVDTTGAGDAFAAGYLHAHLEGRDPEACARMANELAAGIVGVEGCDYQALPRR
jgi:sugar/nucleoside kinase (ribokinase family)